MTPTLRFMTGELSGREVPVEGERFRIGRDPAMDFAVPGGQAKYVSRAHATLSLEGEAWWVSDEDSSNGTFLNGQRVVRSRLVSGDVLQFGRGGPEARFEIEGDRTVLAEAPAADRTALAATDGVLLGDGGASSGAGSRTGSGPALGRGSGHTRYVHALVDEAVGDTRKRLRRAGGLSAAAVGVAVLVLAGWGYSTFVGDPERRFEGMADRLTGSVFLIQTGYAIGDKYFATGHGTGFAASEDGLIITNKHVVFSELFAQSSACLHASLRRARIDADAARVVTVWKGGTQFRQTRGDPYGDRGLGWSSQHGALEIASVAPNNLGPEKQVTCNDPIKGDRFRLTWREHLSDNADIAVLRVTTRLDPIPLAEEEPRADDPVMVFGFPAGLLPQETNTAEPIRRTGEVIRVQETIQIGAPVLGGNSGGPLLNLRGEVVGITTRGHVTSLQNNALKIAFARRVLERARVAAAR